MSSATPRIELGPGGLDASELLVSDSLMDRLFIDYSVDGSGPLTRSLDDGGTSGFIRDDAPHWAIEPFIPIEVNTLIEYLTSRGELASEQDDSFREFNHKVNNILHQQRGAYHTRFADAYALFDPDTDSRRPAARQSDPQQLPTDLNETDRNVQRENSLELASPEADVAGVISLCEEILQEAGYHRLSQADVEQCAGVSSQWGVPLHVDFGLFNQLLLFARGDIIGTRLRRRLRTLYRRESVAVPIYQRMVVVFQLRDDDKSEENLAASALHLRMFKNIPKQDVDMLLPGSRVRISGLDRIKIVVPSLGGFLISLQKMAQITRFILLFAAFALHWTAVLIALLCGYMVKSVMSYFQTKNRYQLNLTRNLYFQKLDTNAGVAYRMIQQAHRQTSVEMILAYYAILTSEEPISIRRLRRRCERMVREAVDVEVDFRVERTLERLVAMEVIQQVGDRWTVVQTV